ncbi:hypothetical protein KCU88_g345, partial [Aureobasidium melanogenum]
MKRGNEGLAARVKTPVYLATSPARSRDLRLRCSTYSISTTTGRHGANARDVEVPVGTVGKVVLILSSAKRRNPDNGKRSSQSADACRAPLSGHPVGRDRRAMKELRELYARGGAVYTSPRSAALSVLLSFLLFSISS